MEKSIASYYYCYKNAGIQNVTRKYYIQNNVFRYENKEMNSSFQINICLSLYMNGYGYIVKYGIVISLQH